MIDLKTLKIQTRPRRLALIAAALLIVGSFAFQNCAKVNFTGKQRSASKATSSTHLSEPSAEEEISYSGGNSNGDAYSGKVTRYIHWSQPGECGGDEIAEKSVILYDTIEYDLVKENCIAIAPRGLDSAEIQQIDEDTIQFSQLEFTQILPSSCFEIFNLGGADGNGYYSIDSDGPGGQEPQSVYCDMDVVSGGWTPWSFWTDCSASCGGGEQTRTRQCETNNCRGPSEEVQSCNDDPC